MEFMQWAHEKFGYDDSKVAHTQNNLNTSATDLWCIMLSNPLKLPVAGPLELGSNGQPNSMQTSAIMFKGMAKKAWDKYMVDSGRQFATLTFSQDEAVMGHIVVEIFTDHCPKTSEHFIKLLTANRARGELGYEVAPAGQCLRFLLVINCQGSGSQGVK